MASTEGGVEIEQVAAENPEAIVKVAINPLVGLRSYHVNQLVYGAGFDERARRAPPSSWPSCTRCSWPPTACWSRSTRWC